MMPLPNEVLMDILTCLNEIDTFLLLKAFPHTAGERVALFKRAMDQPLPTASDLSKAAYASLKETTKRIETNSNSRKRKLEEGPADDEALLTYIMKGDDIKPLMESNPVVKTLFKKYDQMLELEKQLVEAEKKIDVLSMKSDLRGYGIALLNDEYKKLEKETFKQGGHVRNLARFVDLF